MDVDKWDYLLRDSLYAGLGHGSGILELERFLLFYRPAPFYESSFENTDSADTGSLNKRIDQSLCSPLSLDEPEISYVPPCDRNHYSEAFNFRSLNIPTYCSPQVMRKEYKRIRSLSNLPAPSFATEEARAPEVIWHMSILASELENVQRMFSLRLHLHRRLYQHKAVVSIQVSIF
ncbi:unnamed protein product [Protopolystoma xenopodis]|uniref:Uncharacterized protein n=1 Tax=Protopolystoma xenopodis TaxID=117903 RepID=A0A3S5ATW8_9PLAT|nr:unnamed protein product [Protopolystoma xenopodis]